MHTTLNARFKSRPVTGVERFAGEVSDRLAYRKGVEFESVTPEHPLHGLRGHVWEQFSLPRKIHKDTVLFSPCNTGPLSVRRQLVVIHDAAVWDCPEGFSLTFRNLYQQLLPALARRSARIATVSEFSRQRLAERLRLPAEEIAVLGNAAGPEFSTAEEVDTSSKKAPTLLCVGSLDPRKNTGRLIEAWIDANERRALPENAQLLMIGSARPSTFGQIELSEAPGIQWLGRVSDAELINHYRTANAFVFPSLYEGFGLPPLEAMACGCPVLLSDQASLPEVGGEAFDSTASDSTGAAVYFDPLSVSDISSAIEKVLNFDPNTRSQMSFNAVSHAATFSWQDVAARTHEVLESI